MQQHSLILEAQSVLIQLIEGIQQLTYDEYTERIPLLSKSTIGEHTRHIIEFFQQLFAGYEIGKINYDNRKRDLRMQEDIDFAVECIANIIQQLDKPDKPLYLSGLCIANEEGILTNYYRELLVNVEHCIHHQAIIKVGFLFFEKTENIEAFGVAKSTLEYRKQFVK